MSSPKRNTKTPVTTDSAPNAVGTGALDQARNLSKQAIDLVWNKDCQWSSLFLFLALSMTIYYLFLMPEIEVKLKENKEVQAHKVSYTLRAWLAVTTAVGGFVGALFIRQGCTTTNSQVASFLWFAGAWLALWVLTRLVLAGVEKTTLAQASELLKQLS